MVVTTPPMDAGEQRKRRPSRGAVRIRLDLAAGRAALREVDGERTPAELLAIPSFNGLGCVFLFHVNKAESTAPIGLTVENNLRPMYCAVRSKQFTKVLVGGRPR